MQKKSPEHDDNDKAQKPGLPTRTHSEILPTMKIRRVSVKEKSAFKKTKSNDPDSKSVLGYSKRRISQLSSKNSNDELPTYDQETNTFHHEKKDSKSHLLSTPQSPPKHPTIQIPQLAISHVSEFKSQPLTTREDYYQKLNMIKNAVSPRILRTAREARKFVKKNKEDSSSSTDYMGTVIMFPPAPPASPIKTRTWSQISLERASELGFDHLEFLCELHDLLVDDKDANLKFLEVDGFSKLIPYLQKSGGPVIRKILDIIYDSLQEREVFVKLLIDMPDNLSKITHLLLKFPKELNVKSQVYQILSLLSEVAQSLELPDFDAHAAVMGALYYYKSKSSERSRFEHLVTSFKEEISREEESEDSDEYCLAVFKLINNIVDGYDYIEGRISIRAEFSKLGLDPVIDSVIGNDKYKDSMLVYFIQAYLMSKELDLNNETRENSTKYEKPEAIQITEDIFKRFSSHSHIQNLFLNSLHSFNQVDDNIANWLFLDKIIYEVSTQQIDIPNWLNEAKINLESSSDIQRLFKAVINEERMREKAIESYENQTIHENKILELEAKLQKKKAKINLLNDDLREYEDELEHVEEHLTSKLREVDGLLEEYDDMLDEYEDKFDQIQADLSQTKSNLDLKAQQYAKLISGDFSDLDDETINFLRIKISRGNEESHQPTVTSPHSKMSEDYPGNIPKWKLQQQKTAQELQERRERERAAKLSKVNFIRQRIKEIGHDAVSLTIEEEETSPKESIPPIPNIPTTTPTPNSSVPVANTTVSARPAPISTDLSAKTYSKAVPITNRLKSVSRARLEPDPNLITMIEKANSQSMDDLQAKFEKQTEIVAKLEKEIQQKNMQILAFEKEKEARLREEKKLQIKLQRTEEEKENVQRQRVTLQEEMKKLAQQRERINNEAKKDKLWISKSKQEIEKIRLNLEEEKEVFAKEQERVKKELDEKLEQIRIEKEILEEDLMQEYLELQELIKKNKGELNDKEESDTQDPI